MNTEDPDAREERVARWLAEVVAVCPWCDALITRTTPRGLDYQERISCLGCLDEGAEGPCVVCRLPITRREKRDHYDGGLAHGKCVERKKRR